MKCFYESPETHYGVEDLFPSHGHRRWYIEPDEDDAEEIRKQILEAMEDAENYLESVEVSLYCPKADRWFDIQEYTEDWFSKDEIKSLKKKYGVE